MSKYQTISVGRDGDVVTISLDRPERLNAITSQMLQEVAHAYTNLGGNVRVVILEGNGRSFCSGADRKDPPGLAPAGSDHATELMHAGAGRRAARAIAEAPMVTVARLHGHVIGGGAVLALNCDFRIGDETTAISFPEVRLGIPLTWGALPVLEREVGASKARNMVYFGEPVHAHNALEIGLLHKVVAPELLADETRRFVGQLLDLPEVSVRMSKRQFLEASSARGDRLDALDAELYVEAMGSGVETLRRFPSPELKQPASGASVRGVGAARSSQAIVKNQDKLG